MLINHVPIINRILTLEELAQLLDSVRESYRASDYYCKVVMTSGYFLFLHDGHIEYLCEATKFGNIWVTLVNGDNATIKKYGQLYIPASVRANVVSSLKFVHYTAIVDEPEMSGAIRKLKPDIVMNSGDRHNIEECNREEIKACRDVKCEIKFGKGGKINSSSNILSNILSKLSLEILR